MTGKVLGVISLVLALLAIPFCLAAPGIGVLGALVSIALGSVSLLQGPMRYALFAVAIATIDIFIVSPLPAAEKIPGSVLASIVIPYLLFAAACIYRVRQKR